MKEKIWELLKKKCKNEKGFQAFIMEGIGIALTVIGTMLFLLLLTAVKRSLGI